MHLFLNCCMQTILDRGLENPRPFIINKDDGITGVHLITTALTAQGCCFQNLVKDQVILMMMTRRITEGWCVQISHAEFSEEILHNAARATPFQRFRLKRGVWRSGHTFFQQSLRLLQRRSLHWAHDKSACKEIRSELLYWLCISVAFGGRFAEVCSSSLLIISS